MGINTPSNNLDIKKFYEQWWTIDQLVNSFWTTIPDSCKKSAERWNLNSLENVIKTFDLFQKSKNKTLRDCAKECNVSNLEEDLKSCHNLIILQEFCKEKELHLDKIDDVNIDFLDFSAINIIDSYPKSLSNKWKIKEIRDGIEHSKYVCLPEWIYIDNPIWPKHPINFKAIVKRSFIESLVWNLYYKIQKHYIDIIDCWEVNFDEWFEKNKDNIKRVRIKSKNKSTVPQREKIIQSYTRFVDYWYWDDCEKKEYNFSGKETKQLKTFFDSHVFWPWELLMACARWPLHNISLIEILDLLNQNRTYEDFINNEEVRHKMFSTMRSVLDLPMVPADFNKYYKWYYRTILPDYFELQSVLSKLINDIFTEHPEILQRNYNERIRIVLDIVNERLEDYIAKFMESDEYYKRKKYDLEVKKYYLKHNWEDLTVNDHFKISNSIKESVNKKNVSEYKDEISGWRDLGQTRKNKYLNMMKEDLLKIFDVEFTKSNDRNIGLNFILEEVINFLEAIYVSNYYINDPSLIPLWNVQNIPEREHIRNAFSHINYKLLPWTNEILLRDPSRRKDSPDREKIYDLQKLYERCLRKTDNRFVS